MESLIEQEKYDFAKNQARWEVCDYAEPDGHGIGMNHYPKGGLCCNACHHVWRKEKVAGALFCPNCDAKMDGTKND